MSQGRRHDTIDYYFESTLAKVTGQAVLLWVFVAVVFALILLPAFKRGRLNRHSYTVLILLAFYFAFLFYITIIDRKSGNCYQYELELFWSYKAALGGTTQLLWENFLNVVLFVPLGILLSGLWKRRWVVSVAGAAISSAIELTQLVTKRGLFEFDDIFHNTLGAVVGMLIFLFLNRIVLRGTGRRQVHKNDG